MHSFELRSVGGIRLRLVMHIRFLYDVGGMALRYRIPLFLVLASILFVACTDVATLRTSQPIAPVRDYETILVGNLEANYIGDDNCLSKCHVHDRIASDFKHSIHGDQISEEAALRLQDPAADYRLPDSGPIDALPALPFGGIDA
jgi:hypothetical protein